MLRASAVSEAAGVPASTVCCEGFVVLAKATSVGQGMPNIPLAIVPGHTNVQTPEELARNVREVTLQQVIANTAVQTVLVSAMSDLQPFMKGVLLNHMLRRVKRLVPAYSLPGHVLLSKALAEGARECRSVCSQEHGHLVGHRRLGDGAGLYLCLDADRIDS